VPYRDFLPNSQKSVDNKLYSYIEAYNILIFLLLLTIIIILELIFPISNTTIGSLTYFALLVSVIILINPYILAKFEYEKFFLIVFSSFILFFSVVPHIFYNIIEVYYPNLLPNSDNLVYNLLTRPLVSLLSLVGHEIFGMGSTIAFYDVTTESYLELSITKGCSGLYSVLIFISAFFSYIVCLGSKNLRAINFTFVMLGILLAYIANIMRMAIIVMIGESYGIEALLWTHANLGPLIFLLWSLIFWQLYFFVSDFVAD